MQPLLLQRANREVERLIDFRLHLRLMLLHLTTYRSGHQTLRLRNLCDRRYLLLLLLFLLNTTGRTPPLMPALNRSPSFYGVIICGTCLLLLLCRLLGLLLLLGHGNFDQVVIFQQTHTGSLRHRYW